jgi:CRP-like cAMP-binding protein
LIPKDEYIIKQGELATEMFFIMKGEVRVLTEAGITVATLTKNMHFGEMALIQDKVSVRNTSIIANTNVVLAVLTAKDFKLICTHYPDFFTRMK